jgi:hypothetical protein
MHGTTVKINSFKMNGDKHSVSYIQGWLKGCVSQAAARAPTFMGCQYITGIVWKMVLVNSGLYRKVNFFLN